MGDGSGARIESNFKAGAHREYLIEIRWRNGLESDSRRGRSRSYFGESGLYFLDEGGITGVCCIQRANRVGDEAALFDPTVGQNFVSNHLRSRLFEGDIRPIVIVRQEVIHVYTPRVFNPFLEKG